MSSIAVYEDIDGTIPYTTSSAVASYVVYDQTNEEVSCLPGIVADQQTIYFGVPDRVFPMTCEYIDSCASAGINVQLSSADIEAGYSYHQFLYL